MLSREKEAYLNEFKGNLYEYLVANFLASQCDTTEWFLSSLGPHFQKQLIDYELMLRKYSPNLIQDLPVMAGSLADEILKVVGAQKYKVHLIGKITTAKSNNQWAEADIVLESKKMVPISIKLSKENSFVNTKSAGIRSFLKTYFQEDKLQEDFNKFIDYHFDTMALKVHEVMNIDYHSDFSGWIAAGFSELPGGQPPEVSEVLHDYYHTLAKELFRLMELISIKNKHYFSNQLLPLIGYSENSILQAITYYKSSQKNSPSFYHLLKEQSPQMDDVSLISPREGVGNFEIKLKDLILQIRIKPMNKFTTAAYKINCSVKFSL